MCADALERCPQCQRGKGHTSRVVRQEPKHLRVLLRCDWCRHRWAIVVLEDSITGEVLARLTGETTWPAS